MKILKKEFDKKNRLMLIPVFGVLIFCALYVTATFFYPGGSQINKNFVGFSWAHNYWCNLLNDQAINGQHNPAKPIAITGMLVLCLALSFFWSLFPLYIQLSKKWNRIIQVSGVLTATIAFFLFTNINHDLIINLASTFGLIATLGTFIGLYKTKRKSLFMFGLFNVLLIVLNNYVYHTIELIVYLPVIQKITFGTFLFWISCINLSLYHQQKKTGNLT